MSSIGIKSNTSGFIIVGPIHLSPMQEEIEEVSLDQLTSNQLKSLLNMFEQSLIILSETDAETLRRLVEKPTQQGPSYDDTEIRDLLDGKLSIEEKGINLGIATLDESGKIPSVQLPSYVDDVLEFNSLTVFPQTGESGKIYVATDSNISYRWSGSAYVKISSGEVVSVNSKTGAVTLTKADLGLNNVNNTADNTKVVASAGKWTTKRTVTFRGGAVGTLELDGSADQEVILELDVDNLISISDPRITNWEAASSASHSHTNKSILDNTSASFTTVLQTKLNSIAENANNYSHPNSGVTAGTYKSVTVNALGHVTGGSNPTTLEGYGITDAYTKTELNARLSAIETAIANLESAVAALTPTGE